MPNSSLPDPPPSKEHRPNEQVRVRIRPRLASNPTRHHDRNRTHSATEGNTRAGPRSRAIGSGGRGRLLARRLRLRWREPQAVSPGCATRIHAHRGLQAGAARSCWHERETCKSPTCPTTTPTRKQTPRPRVTQRGAQQRTARRSPDGSDPSTTPASSAPRSSSTTTIYIIAASACTPPRQSTTAPPTRSVHYVSRPSTRPTPPTPTGSPAGPRPHPSSPPWPGSTNC